MVHSNDDAMNKIPLKSASGLDDEEKNGGEFIHDTAAAEEARREQMRVNLLKWMKKLTIVLICFIGLALISYVIISLCFSDDSNNNNSVSSTSDSDENNNNTNKIDVTQVASFGGFSDKHVAETTTHHSTITKTTITSTSDAVSAAASSSKLPTPTVAATAATKLTEQPTTAFPRDMPNPNRTAKLAVYSKAAVVSDKLVCSQIGSKILEDGGSAVDSAIAALLCNGIVTMQSMGIGGGMLMNVYIKESKHAYSIDAREVAPYEAVAEMFDKDDSLSLNGGLSIEVPGEVMGYHRAHERFGKLPWKQLVEPSIKLCNDGFLMTEHQRTSLMFKLPHLKNNTLITKVFFNAEGDVHPVGTKLKPQQQLCDTYELLANNGPLDFYNGTLANLIVEDLKDLGSKVNSYDLETYAADLVSSITMPLGDDILYAVPPISSGIVVANILSTLQGYNFTSADLLGAENEATTIHRFAEAMKFGFAKRWELGDLRFNEVRELISQLTNPDNSIGIRAKINDSATLNDISEYGAQFMGIDDVGTSHLNVLAPNGDAVSVTSSINDYFGCGQAGKRTGIVFNSGMNDFSLPGKSNIFGLPAAASNFIDAGKRAMSSMSPMILADRNGDIRMAFGASGGSKIISAIVEVAARVLWFGQDVKQAIDAPRFHHQLLPNVLQYQEDYFSEKLIKLLQEKGHTLKPYAGLGSIVSAIVRNATAIYANADYRKNGDTAGF